MDAEGQLEGKAEKRKNKRELRLDHECQTHSEGNVELPKLKIEDKRTGVFGSQCEGRKEGSKAMARGSSKESSKSAGGR